MTNNYWSTQKGSCGLIDSRERARIYCKKKRCMRSDMMTIALLNWVRILLQPVGITIILDILSVQEEKILRRLLITDNMAQHW